MGTQPIRPLQLDNRHDRNYKKTARKFLKYKLKGRNYKQCYASMLTKDQADKIDVSRKLKWNIMHHRKSDCWDGFLLVERGMTAKRWIVRFLRKVSGSL
jgi:hypothetical protein